MAARAGMRCPHPANALHALLSIHTSQYEREQALLRAKSARQQEAHTRLLRSLHPQQEDKAAAWEELVAANSLLASRRPEREEPQSQIPSPDAQTALPEGARPWHHATATQQYSLEAEEAARRRFAAEVAAGAQGTSTFGRVMYGAVGRACVGPPLPPWRRCVLQSCVQAP